MYNMLVLRKKKKIKYIKKNALGHGTTYNRGLCQDSMPGTLRGTLSPIDADVSGGAVLDMVKFHYVSQ